MSAVDFHVLRTCLRCLGPITVDGLPCPNPECPVGYSGQTWRQPTGPTSMSMSATFSTTMPPASPAVQEVVYQKRLGMVMYPNDWLVPPRPAWAWVKV